MDGTDTNAVPTCCVCKFHSFHQMTGSMIYLMCSIELRCSTTIVLARLKIAELCL